MYVQVKEPEGDHWERFYSFPDNLDGWEEYERFVAGDEYRGMVDIGFRFRLCTAPLHQGPVDVAYQPYGIGREVVFARSNAGLGGSTLSVGLITKIHDNGLVSIKVKNENKTVVIPNNGQKLYVIE